MDDLIRNNININNLKSIIMKEKTKSNKKLMKDWKINSHKKIYVNYPGNGIINYYNEIYTYLIDNKKFNKDYNI